MRGDRSSAPRIAYLEGDVEIMSPSQTHKGIKSMNRMSGRGLLPRPDISFSTCGSGTLQSEDRSRARGAPSPTSAISSVMRLQLPAT